MSRPRPSGPSHSSRRTLLATASCVGLGLLGGCLAGDLDDADGSDDADQSPSTLASSTSPRSPEESATTDTEQASPSTPLPDETVPFPDGPKRRPERPERLTLETARSFVRTHEYRYVYNQLWYDESTDVNLECEVLTAREVDVGYKVVVSCTGYSNTGGEQRPNSTATSTVVHADYFTQVYTYLLDEESLVRRRATEEEGGNR
jgi:hypothetical protein